MGHALVLHEAVLARRVNGRFVEALGVQFALFQTRELGADNAARFANVAGPSCAQTAICLRCNANASRCWGRSSAAAMSQYAARASAA
jgi:hypothetical protein